MEALKVVDADLAEDVGLLGALDARGDCPEIALPRHHRQNDRLRPCLAAEIADEAAKQLLEVVGDRDQQIVAGDSLQDPGHAPLQIPAI